MVRHINGLDPESKDITQPIFHLDFYQGLHVNKSGTQGSNICGKFSSSS